MTTIFYDDLKHFVYSVLVAAGLDSFSAEAVETGLCETSLRGVDSHGIRLLPHYIDSALSGRKNPRPVFKFQQTLPAIGWLNADNAFGHASGMCAIDHCIESAEALGIGAVAVSNSSHPGAMASFTLKAARKGYIAFAFTHADSLLLSPNGTRPFFGTNPVCMAAPREEDEPYCLDMATSVIPWNRLRMHRDSGQPLPDGVAADKRGYPTVDPYEATCLMPVGSPLAGYKGYALASMVEILSGVYSGVPVGRDIPAMYQAPMDAGRNLGQFYMVMRTDGAISPADFRVRLQQMTNAIRSEPSRDGNVMLPGDKETREAARRLRDGVPLDSSTVTAFEGLAARFAVELRLR